MDYGTFATLMSIFGVGLYLVLLVIAVRRMQRRTIQSPPMGSATEAAFISLQLVIALATLASAVTVGHAEFAEVPRFAISVIRGAILAGGVFLLGYYLRMAETWT